MDRKYMANKEECNMLSKEEKYLAQQILIRVFENMDEPDSDGKCKERYEDWKLCLTTSQMNILSGIINKLGA
ncbi:MAG: hypothetical protein LBH91_04855 [Prevotellaceae bacterium]|nr:hypothetical protein [Prevotellaceae bacterium]